MLIAAGAAVVAAFVALPFVVTRLGKPSIEE
jgi:hypothetical protein